MKILDCTLRDGGYCNNWKFGSENIKKIIVSLIEAGIEIIECGFLTEKIKYAKDSTRFNTVNDIDNLLPLRKGASKFVCMINYGEYNVSALPDRKNVILDGIRIAFHKKDISEALMMARKVKQKGYEVFLQPMVSLSYSDEEFLDLIRKSNEISPYAFYIVDSFGVMKQRDLIRLFYLVEHNLNKDIIIGFHSHNNMQLAYSNAQALTGSGAQHGLIIDASIFGMGRGAGNLNTELFVEYLNDYYQANYNLKPLLNVIDEIINSFYQKNGWGYSLPNYLSAKYNTHPNYAGYLNSRKTLTIDNMDDIFSMMSDEKRVSYDEHYIENLYIQYLASGEAQDTNLLKLKNIVHNKTIIIIAPGESSVSEKDKIAAAVKDGVISVSINFDYQEIHTDYIFLSNLRRYREISKDKLYKCIVTSNVPTMDAFVKTNYKDLLNENKVVMDNAGLMLIRFMINMGCKEILLAGLDGYDYDISKNFITYNMQTEIKKDWVDEINKGMSNILKLYAKEVPITFLTKPMFVCI